MKIVWRSQKGFYWISLKDKCIDLLKIFRRFLEEKILIKYLYKIFFLQKSSEENQLRSTKEWDLIVDLRDALLKTYNFYRQFLSSIDLIVNFYYVVQFFVKKLHSQKNYCTFRKVLIEKLAGYSALQLVHKRFLQNLK